MLDPEVEALADALVSLEVGLKKACVTFAEALCLEGVMHIRDVAEFTEAEARDMMTRAGMAKLQQNRVMQAVALAPAPAPAPAPPPPHHVLPRKLLLLPLLQLQLPSAALPPLGQGFCAPLVAKVLPTGSSSIRG